MKSFHFAMSVSMHPRKNLMTGIGRFLMVSILLSITAKGSIVLSITAKMDPVNDDIAVLILGLTWLSTTDRALKTLKLDLVFLTKGTLTLKC